MKPAVIQIVRRFGPVGGMERYVWHLSEHLAALGVEVDVLCQRLCAATPPDDVRVHALGEIGPRPRWLALLRFSRRVSRHLAAHKRRAVIHSHERTGVHHITTFHGPPFANILDRPRWRRASLRVQAQLWLERREVCGAQVQKVVPNSLLIAQQLSRFYPCIGRRLESPIPPGVEPGPRRSSRPVPADGGIIGFVGEEWRRKGLEKAIETVRLLRDKRPGLQLWVAGPEPQAVRHLFSGWQDGYRLLGKVEAASLYPQLDLLLHPARHEPFGMVITEAMTAGVPVLVSDACGAAPQIGAGFGRVLSYTSPASAWAEACETLLGKEEPAPAYRRSWRQVAEEYLQLYRDIRP